MTKPTAKTKRRLRSHRLEARVEPRLYDAVEGFAVEHGLTLSTAMCCILSEWAKRERRRVARIADNQ